MTNSMPLPVRGRPPLLTASMVPLIARAVEEGKNREEAAAAAGVSLAAVARWLGRGRQARDSGRPSSELASHDWMCLVLLRAVERAEERRDAARLEAAVAAAQPPQAVGRPPLLSQTLVDTVVLYLMNGGSREGAAASAEVTLRTLQRWLSRGARAHFGVAHTDYEALCAQLYKRVKEVEARAAKEARGLIFDGARLMGLSTVPAELLEKKSLGYAAGGIVLPPGGPVVENRIDWDALPPGVSFKAFSPVPVIDPAGLRSGSAYISPDSIRAETIDPEAIKTRTITAEEINEWAGRIAGEVPWRVDIDLSRPRGRFRTWLRSQLARGKRAV